MIHATPNSTMFAGESADRVRHHTASQVNAQIDQKMAEQVQSYANQPEQIAQRLWELDTEWDTERVLETNASVLAFTGLLLGVFVNANWFWLPGIVLPFLFQHAVQGWCPPLPVIRRLGVRTRNEIDQEKYALKAVRGDFVDMSMAENDPATRMKKALEAVKA